MQDQEKAIFKFNGGRGAILCNDCRVIIKTGISFTEYETEAILGRAELGPQYCNDCKEKRIRAEISSSHGATD
jgi:hypothetical protein